MKNRENGVIVSLASSQRSDHLRGPTDILTDMFLLTFSPFFRQPQ